MTPRPWFNRYVDKHVRVVGQRRMPTVHHMTCKETDIVGDVEDAAVHSSGQKHAADR